MTLTYQYILASWIGWFCVLGIMPIKSYSTPDHGYTEGNTRADELETDGSSGKAVKNNHHEILGDEIKATQPNGLNLIYPLLVVEGKDLDEIRSIERSLASSSINIIPSGSLQDVCRSYNNITVIAIRFGETTEGDLFIPDACAEGKSDIHVLYVVPPWRDFRKKRSYGNLDLYHLIAAASGGTVYETTKGNIGAVVDIIKDSVISSAPVTVLKFKWIKTGNASFEIPVDDQVLNLTIKIGSSSLPTVSVFRPSGTSETFKDAKLGLRKPLGSNLIIIKLYSPATGLWRIQRGSAAECDVEVTGKSRLDFTYRFMQPGPSGIGMYPLVGRPIAGSNTTVQVSVPLVATIHSVDRIVLIGDEGTSVVTADLQNVGGRRGKTLFKTSLVLPSKEFKTSLEGTDKSGNVFRRLDPKLVSTLAIKLQILPASGTLFVSDSITIPYIVSNVGGGRTMAEVKILDDLHFAQTPTTISHSLAPGGSATGKFTLSSGPHTKGQTTTVTISANPPGAKSNRVQYYVQRITVEEKVTKAVDNIPPTCNVTGTTGKCDVGVDVCSCSKLNWSMTTEIGDVGFGLLSVFPSNNGSGSIFTKDIFIPGHQISNGVIHAQLRADCCHQQAQINVVDMVGNVATCSVKVNPVFVAPDPKLCQDSTVSSSSNNTIGVNVSSLSCTTTAISGSCDLRNVSCTGSCRPSDVCGKYNWTYMAEVSNQSIGNIQAVPVKADKHALLDVNNRSIIFRTTCCQPTVVIKVIDFSGKIGQCDGSIPVEIEGPVQTTPSSSTSLPVAVIAGSCAGGIVLVGGITTFVVLFRKYLIKKATVSTTLN